MCTTRISPADNKHLCQLQKVSVCAKIYEKTPNNFKTLSDFTVASQPHLLYADVCIFGAEFKSKTGLKYLSAHLHLKLANEKCYMVMMWLESKDHLAKCKSENGSVTDSALLT